VVGQLGTEGALHQGFLELTEQTLVAEQVLGAGDLSEQLIEEFGLDGGHGGFLSSYSGTQRNAYTKNLTHPVPQYDERNPP
jgi:hypothetical protein